MKRDALPGLLLGRRSTLVVLAPHLSTPLRNGADVYIWNKYAGLDPEVWDARLIAADGIYRLTAPGRWEVVARMKPTSRSRSGAAFCMLTRGLDYLSAKFSTPAYLRLCIEAALHDVDRIVCSYVSTYRIVQSLGIEPGRVIVETHNFDQKVYLDRAQELGGLRRLLAGMAAVNAHALLRTVPRTMPLVALGAADRQLFEGIGYTDVVQGRLGFEARPPRRRFPDRGQPRILFVGSLSMTMNEMALREFVAGPLQILRDELVQPLWFGVAGSRPSPALTAFLEARDVHVHPDPSDDDLSVLLESCHATVLPFTSSNGLKLKFAHSASHGVAIMSFLEPPEGLEAAPGVLVSHDMRIWASWLADLHASPAILEAWSTGLQAAAASQSWAVVVSREMSRFDDPRPRPHVAGAGASP